jgi:hypothetical protein
VVLGDVELRGGSVSLNYSHTHPGGKDDWINGVTNTSTYGMVSLSLRVIRSSEASVICVYLDRRWGEEATLSSHYFSA